MSLSCTVNEILSLIIISQNLKKSRDSVHIPSELLEHNIIMRALVLLCINQHTKFEVHSFTNSKDMIGSKI